MWWHLLDSIGHNELIALEWRIHLSCAVSWQDEPARAIPQVSWATAVFNLVDKAGSRSARGASHPTYIAFATSWLGE
jgi:hypothetical protein